MMSALTSFLVQYTVMALRMLALKSSRIHCWWKVAMVERRSPSALSSDLLTKKSARRTYSQSSSVRKISILGKLNRWYRRWSGTRWFQNTNRSKSPWTAAWMTKTWVIINNAEWQKLASTAFTTARFSATISRASTSLYPWETSWRLTNLRCLM